MSETSSKPAPSATGRGKRREAVRKAKQGALLRENLLKRKAQMRDRAATGSINKSC
tara:strand:- start:1479 stop:1646 length:168 start_codon:yes stop_codon:yes gene_type:complete